MSIRTEKKTCTVCGLEKTLERFHKHEGMADGYYNQCKICMYSDQQARRQSEIKKQHEPNPVSVLLNSWGRV